MTLLKANIIDSIYNSTDLNRHQATRAIETILETIKSRLESGKTSGSLDSVCSMLKKRNSERVKILKFLNDEDKVS
jgi:hypothetical protein